MRRISYLLLSYLALAVVFIATRLPAGKWLTVKYDVLFFNSLTYGYIPTITAVFGKFLCAVLTIMAIIALIWVRRYRIAWLMVLVLSILLSISIISHPRPQDFRMVIASGNSLVADIDSFQYRHGGYPAQLSELENIPPTGLARERRFHYVSSASNKNDSRDWFTNTRAYLGKAKYVSCVPFVPRGTLVYRPNGDYSDLPGQTLADGWFHTSRD